MTYFILGFILGAITPMIAIIFFGGVLDDIYHKPKKLHTHESQTGKEYPCEVHFYTGATVWPDGNPCKKCGAFTGEPPQRS